MYSVGTIKLNERVSVVDLNLLWYLYIKFLNFISGKISFLKNLNDASDANNTCDQSKGRGRIFNLFVGFQIHLLIITMEPVLSRHFWDTY